MKNYFLAAGFLFLVSLMGCSFQKVGRDVSKGLNENTEAIARNLLAGVQKGLSDSAFQTNLYLLVDSLTMTAGGGLNRSVKQLIDTLLSDKWIRFTRQMVEEATGEQLKGNLKAITDNMQGSLATMLGPDTRERVRLLVADAMNEVLSDRLRLAVGTIREEMTGVDLRRNMSALRDSLLNDKTNAAIRGIVDSAMMTIAFRMKNNVNPALQDNLSFIQRNATTLLIVLGIIALVVIIVIWRLKQKYARMTTVVASQIYAIPDQKAYDDLTSRIKEKAAIAGVEPDLRKMLQENGLLGKESRDNWQAKRAAMLENRN